MFAAQAVAAASLAGLYCSWPYVMDQGTQFLIKRNLDPESSHEIFLSLAEYGYLPNYKKKLWRYGSAKYAHPAELKTEFLGKTLTSPVGIAAGLDKNGTIVGPLFDLGCGAVEVGSITPNPQTGNPKPRLFRLAEDSALINRFGFNSLGVMFAKAMLEKWRKLFPKNDAQTGMIGINIGKNKETINAADDYIRGIRELGPMADYLVINISSPNTPGLRDLQGGQQLDDLLNQIMKAKDIDLSVKNVPLFIKISPDMTTQERRDLIRISLSHGISGFVVSNSTVERPEHLLSTNKFEPGGLSGRPLKDKSFHLLQAVYTESQGKAQLISVGGVETGDDVLERLKNGASLVQLYTALAYGGPGTIARINDRLVDLLRAEATTVSEIVRQRSAQTLHTTPIL